MKSLRWEDLGKDDQALVEAAEKAQRFSRSPYSKLAVGSALRLRDGGTISGSNYESASYGLSLCAERSALVQAYQQAGPGQVVRISITATGDLVPPDQPVTPCGACRQWIYEAAMEGQGIDQVILLCVSPDRSRILTGTAAEFLPEGFG